MVSDKMGLPFYRSGGRRTVHNTNFLEKRLFFNNLLSIFVRFSGFVYHVKDYCCANFRSQHSFLIC